MKSTHINLRRFNNINLSFIKIKLIYIITPFIRNTDKMVFSIQYASDLHLEMLNTIPDDLIVSSAPYLVVLGDIGDPFQSHYHDFLADMSSKFEKVFIIAGNHELYRHQYAATKSKIHQVVNNFQNVIFLDNSAYVVDGIKLIGSTLWSEISDHAAQFINDFYQIKISSKQYLTPEIYRSWHREAIKYIEHEIEIDELPTIILTHHAIDKIMNGKYFGNELESAFSTDLPFLCKYPVIAFISGHTHQNIEVKCNDIPIIANCYGYNRIEKSTYSSNKVFTFEKN